MSELLISVIVPCYNQAAFLPDAVESLFAQVYPNWECIIVDDGSGDQTAHVAGAFTARDSRVRVIRQENRGLPNARNRGLKEAKGQLVHFLDADDYILPDMYQKMIEVFQTSSKVSVVYSGCQFVNGDGRLLKAFPALPEPADVLHELLERNPWPCHAIMVRKSAIDSVGPFDFDPVLYGCEDWDLWLRVASSGTKFAPVTGEFACYRRYSNSMSTDQYRRLQAGFSVIERNLRWHKPCPICDATAIRGKHRWMLECWHAFRSEVRNSSTVSKTFGYLHILFGLARTDLRMTCWLIANAVRRRCLTRNLINTPTLNANLRSRK